MTETTFNSNFGAAAPVIAYASKMALPIFVEQGWQTLEDKSNVWRDATVEDIDSTLRDLLREVLKDGATDEVSTWHLYARRTRGWDDEEDTFTVGVELGTVMYL